MAPILSVRNLSTGYGKKQVLFDVSFEVTVGETVLVVGGNGSGKSTLLKSIYGLLRPWGDDAEIIFRPDPDCPAVRTQRANFSLSHGLAYLPQKNGVFDDLTVEDNLRLSGHTLRDQGAFAGRLDEVLSLFPMLPPLLKRKPERMSGGERQMTSLAMVLMHRPKCLLLDEPLTGLDAANALSLINCVADLRKRFGLTFIIAEHRLHEAVHFKGRTLIMRLGRLEKSVDAP